MKNLKPSRRQISLWRKLKKKKFRKSEGLFLAEGERCVSQILQNQFVETEALILSSASGWRPAATDLDIFEMDESDFETLTDTENPQGVAAVCRIPSELPVSELVERSGVVLAADAIQDPGNLGTMIRTASWFGAAAILCGTGTADPYNAKVIRSTAGATGSVPVLSGDLHELFPEMESRGWRVMLLDSGEDSNSVQQTVHTRKTILVVGNEANGVDRRLITEDRWKIRIAGNSAVVESLNAAIAAGIALYELTRLED